MRRHTLRGLVLAGALLALAGPLLGGAGSASACSNTGCTITVSGSSSFSTFISPLTATIGTTVFNEMATTAQPAPGSTVTIAGSLGFTVFDLRGTNAGWVAYLACTGASSGAACMTSSLAPSGNGAQIAASQFSVSGTPTVQLVPFFGSSFAPGVSIAPATGNNLATMQAVAGECAVPNTIGMGIYNVTVPLSLVLTGLQVDYVTLPATWTGSFDLTVIEGPAAGGVPTSGCP